MREGGSMKVGAIADEHTVVGFALLGVKDTKIAKTPQETETCLDEFLCNPEIGVIILMDHLAEGIRSTVSRIQDEKEAYPIIIEISGKDGPVERQDSISSLVRRAVGVSLMKGGM